MTRITNFGRKRTYLEAGFTDPEPTNTTNSGSPVRKNQLAPSSTSDAEPTTTTKDQSHIPSLDAKDGDGDSETLAEKRQHRKRHRSKKGKGPLGMSQAQTGNRNEGDAAGSGSNAAGPSEPKKKKQKLERPRLNGGGARRDGPFDRREERRVKRINEKLETTTCFACREKGHAARDCPNAAGSSQAAQGDDEDDIGDVPRPNPQTKTTPAVGICYRCGSSKHNLSRCRKPADPENPLPFASCFVCSGKGHLAGSCPKNQNKGVYPNGGCCKICGDTTHLAKDCNVRRNEIAAKAAVGTGSGAGADEDDFMVLKRRTKLVEKEETQEDRWNAVADASAKAPGRLKRDNVSVASAAKKKVVVF